ncbi:NAD-dependent_deacytelase Sir2 [Hexamita inflata]|nr:NAD-dependent deacytelase Sir2 [Hexamita inflata]CAI9959527.1 NAD-dependent deacytelase Sir2 [Hexamita inflata]
MSSTFTNKENLLALAKLLASGEPVVFLTGAGLSVSSGITPYRYTSQAIWSNFVVEQGTRKTFKKDPEAWWNDFWLRTHEKQEFISAKPNPGHFAITHISKRCPNVRVVTQNIDTLHTKACLDPTRIVEVHGSLGKYKCVNQQLWKNNRLFVCPYSTHRVVLIPDLNQYALPNTSLEQGNLRVRVPRCPGCLDPLMPLTLLFDEKYQSHDGFGYARAERWFAKAKAIVFVGTSLSVNVTSEAINVGEKNGAELFNFNIMEDDTKMRGMRWILGKAEETLMELEKAVAQEMTKTGPDGKPRMRMCAWK